MAARNTAQSSAAYRQHDDNGRPGRAGHDTGRLQHAEHEAGTLKDRALRFYKKFNNDWSMNLVAMLSYNVLTSVLPLLLAVLTILALLPVVSNNAHNIALQINQILPSNVRSSIDVESLLKSVHSKGGILAIVSILGLLWGGTNLFGAIESAFAVIFRVKVRGFLRQKLMSIAMILLLVVLLPISFVSSIVLTLANTTVSKIVPSAISGPAAQIVGYAASLASLFVLFAAIYIVVPNLPVAWRNAWRGALFAAIAMWIINTTFPFYTAHFVNTKQYGAAAIATAIVTITWFWFFSLILVVGAQLNSLAMGVGPLPFDIPRVLMDYKVPTEGGEPTGLDAVRDQKPPEEALPFSGVARDSQDVHDAVPPASPPGKVDARDAKDGDKSDTPDRKDGDKSGSPDEKHGAPVMSRDGARPSTRHARQPDTAVRAVAASRSSAPRHDNGGASGKDDGPRPARAMPSDLIATEIAPGGVKMATPRDVFGEPQGPPKELLILGGAFGLFAGIRQALRHPAKGA